MAYSISSGDGVLVRLGAWVDAAISPQVYRAFVQLPLSRLPNKTEPLRDLDAVRSFFSGSGPGVLFDLPVGAVNYNNEPQVKGDPAGKNV